MMDTFPDLGSLSCAIQGFEICFLQGALSHALARVEAPSLHPFHPVPRNRVVVPPRFRLHSRNESGPRP